MTERNLTGRTFRPWTYEVGIEKIREFATALGHGEACYFDREVARSMGFRDVVAPPMFAVVFCKWMGPAVRHPDVGIDYARMLHGGQEFEFGAPVCHGDVITTSAAVADVYAKRDLEFFVFSSHSANQFGETVADGRWTMIVRGSDGQA
ncbi:MULTISPECIES: FAS1-like dehydratase domain-containing protein [Amycolatopsis]|uniref:Acyl dehydratase n=1 Tax=Amycolatopsis thermoflava TaxID=84480 RepID=A0A3N2H744_9PSEU|nr:MaoC family dehydratase N-terminal domain-containing protein [Amycolatopsis thermoflava]ROS44150.1 acyl dehydratase [Amycolatopsis thermoflava]